MSSRNRIRIYIAEWHAFVHLSERRAERSGFTGEQGVYRHEAVRPVGSLLSHGEESRGGAGRRRLPHDFPEIGEIFDDAVGPGAFKLFASSETVGSAYGRNASTFAGLNIHSAVADKERF